MNDVKDKDSFLKSRFVEAMTNETFQEIANRQDQLINDILAQEKKVVADFGKEKLNFIKKMQGHFSVNIEGTGVKGTMRVLKYTRFLDMKTLRGKKKEQFHLYNRLVFGALYKGYVPKLTFGFTESVKKQLSQQYKIEL